MDGKEIVASIKHLEMVKSVRIDNDYILTVKTKPLVALATGVIFGRYTIIIKSYISPTTQERVWHFSSIQNSRPIYSREDEIWWHHPHIDGDRYKETFPCWGNCEDTIQENSPEVTVALIIDFLQSYKPHRENCRCDHCVVYCRFERRQNGSISRTSN